MGGHQDASHGTKPRPRGSGCARNSSKSCSRTARQLARLACRSLAS
jgi:hypothetical protein